MQEKLCIQNETLNAYLSLWNNRQINSKDLAEEEILKELVRRELLDENAHPRARKSIYEKFYLSVKRVSESVLSASKQAAIIRIYVAEFEEIQRGK